MNPVELERRLQRIERQLDELASAGRPRVQSGTWTPDMYGATTYGVTTYVMRSGTYVVINRVCVIWGVVWWTATTATGALCVTVPFTCDSTLFFPPAPIRHSMFAYAANATLYAEIVQGAAYLRIIQETNDGLGVLINVPPAGYLSFTGIYLIAP